MAKCLEPKESLIRLMKGVKGKSILFKNSAALRAKPERFPTSKIINTYLINVFSNHTDENYEISKKQAIEKIEAIIKDGRTIIPAFWKKMQAMNKFHSKDATMFHNEDGSNASGMQIIQRGIAAQHVFASVKSEHDLTVKYNLNEADISQLEMSGELTPAIAALGNLAAIGREVAYTQNLSYTPKRKGVNIVEAQWQVEKSYARIGLKAMQSLEESGIISINENGSIINRNFKKKEDGSPYKESQLILSGTSISINMENMIPNYKSLSAKEKRLISKYMKKDVEYKETKQVQEDYPILAANVNAANWVHKLKVPSNLKLPGFEYPGVKTEPEPANHDVAVHKDTQSTLDQKEEGTLVVSTELEGMFDFIAEYMERHKVSFEQAAVKLDSRGYKELMGFSDELDSTSATRDSDRGKSLSKTIPVSDFFDNYLLFRRLPFHLKEEIKRNGRGHYMNTVLNPQTDKFFSRFVVSITPYSLEAFKDGEPTRTFTHMVKAVEDQAGSKITQDAIMNHGVDKDLDYLLASYENSLSDGKSMFTFMSLAFKNSKTDLAGSPWQKMDTLKGILSVRNAVEDASEGGNSMLEGSFMPKPDGTASGAVIMALQMAGKNHGNASLYEALGLDREDVQAGLRDAYEITEKVLTKLIGNKDALKDSPLKSTVKFLFEETNIYKELRDISKDPSMTVMYNQSVARAADTLAAGFADKIYRRLVDTKNKKEKELIKNRIYDWMVQVDPDLAENYKDKDASFFISSDNSKEVYEVMKSYLQEEVGLPMANLVDTEFANEYLSGHRDFTDSLFTEMEKIQSKTGRRVTMAPPATIVAETMKYNRELKGNDWKFDATDFELLPDDRLKGLESRGVPMMKLFEVVENPNEDNTIMRKEILHAINGKVNSIHSIDFAILNEAFQRTFDQYTKGGNKDFPLKPEDIVKFGTVSVHDAISANPEFSMLYETNYREAARDVNMMFDINKQLGHTLMAMTDGSNTAVNTLYKEAKEQEQAKVTTLSTMPWDTKKVFGFDEELKAQPNLKNGRGKRSLLSSRAKNQSTKNQQEMDDNEMLNSRVSVVEAEESFEAVGSLVESGEDYFAMDTETTNRANDGTPHKKVAPSDVLSVTVAKMNGVNPVLEDGEPVVRTFYFKGNPTRAASAVHGLSNTPKKGRKTINQLIKEQEGGSEFNSNEDIWKAFSKYVGGTPMTAFNANFDMDSLNISKENITGKKGGLDFNDDVYDMYGASVHALSKSNIDVQNNNNMKGVYEKVGLNESNPWSDEDAHTSEYDVERMADIIRAVYAEGIKKKTSDNIPVLERKRDNSEFYINEDSIPESVLSDKRYDALTDFIKEKVGHPHNFEALVRDHPKVYSYLHYLYGRANKPELLTYVKDGFYSAAGLYDPNDHSVGIRYGLNDKAGRYVLAHELIHAITSKEIRENPNGSFAKTVNMAFTEAKKNATGIESEYWRQSVDEFVAELFSRKDLGDFLKGMKGKPEHKTFFKKMIEAIVSLITGKKKGDTEHKTMYDTLLSSFTRIDNAGLPDLRKTPLSNLKSLESRQSHPNQSTKREQRQALRDALEYTKSTSEFGNGIEPLSRFMTNNNDWVADLLWNHLGPDAETLVHKGATAVDEYLTEKSDYYVKGKRLINNVWDSDSMQQIKPWLAPGMIKNRKDMQEFQAISSDASKKANKLTSTELSKLDNMMSGMTNKEKADLNTIFARAPIFMLIKNGDILSDIATGRTTIDEAIATAESESANNDNIELAKQMADMYIDGEVDSLTMRYNLEKSNHKANNKATIETLTALYSINKVENAEKTIRKTKTGNGSLFKSFSDLSMSLEKLTIDSYAKTDTRMDFRGNFTLDYYKDPISLRVLTPNEFDSLESTDSDEYTVVLSAEENHGYPVVAFKQTASYQQGLGTNISYGTTDATMPKEFKMRRGKSKGLVRHGDSKNPSYSVVIPHKKKQELGLIENPAHTLIRSFAHIQEIIETQAIRDHILDSSEIRMDIPSLESGYQDTIVEKIKDKEQDEPWVISLGSGVKYTDLPAEIKHRYKKVDSSLSNVGVFSSKLNLVRRDVAPWLIGYEKTEPFKGVPILGKTARVVAQAVALMKIHQIIVNPAKVTLDAISTTTLLASNGVSLPFIANGWRRNIPLISDYAQLRAEQVEASIAAYAGDKTAQKKLLSIEKKLRDHELAGEMKAGVNQSLSTDIILRDYDTITGLQRNIEKILEKATNKDDGSLNDFGKAVIAFSKAGSSMGLNIENVFEKIASLTEHTEQFNQMAEELRIMGERVATMKNNDEAARYLAEYFASPDSNLTRLGSIATTYPDMMSRIIYRQYLIANWEITKTRELKDQYARKNITLKQYSDGIKRAKEIKTEADMTDEEIVELNSMVSDFMPDYLYAPPQIMDTLGRFYVVPFVSFTARIQRTIAVLAKRNPLTVIGMFALAGMFDVDESGTPYHIVGSNITEVNMFNNPIEDLFDMNTILPTEVFNTNILRF